jgi:pilus assembly protein Flp/PilA
MRTLRRLWRDEEAATATEYGIIAAILAVGLIAVLVLFRNRLVGMFTKAADAVNQ